jgi:hypothetical protein
MKILLAFRKAVSNSRDYSKAKSSIRISVPDVCLCIFRFSRVSTFHWKPEKITKCTVHVTGRSWNSFQCHRQLSEQF